MNVVLMNEEKISEMRQRFSELDIEDKGKLSRQNVADILSTESEQIERLMVTLLFGKYDKNEDQFIDFEEFCEQFEIEIESEMNSVGGFVMEQLSKVPSVGDKFAFENLSVEVTKTDERRAEEIIVKVSKKLQEDEE